MAGSTERPSLRSLGSRVFNALRGYYWWIVSVGMAVAAKMLRLRYPADLSKCDNFRMPRNDDEARYWLSNMIEGHGFSVEEVSSATGYSDSQIRRLHERFRRSGNLSPTARNQEDLVILPYPGGRHPRLGFQDGAILPQRDTKVSVFSPWDPFSYAVADVPEAIFSGLGVIFLAHTHVATIWEKRGIRLPPSEWNRHHTGVLSVQRRLPDGIGFGIRATTDALSLTFRLWLINRGRKCLTRLRIQNCVLLGQLRGFENQTNRNKIFQAPYVACRSLCGERWIIAASKPCWRVWANPLCPCIHSDAYVPDCAPGEAHEIIVKLWFYVGTEIYPEFRRLNALGWGLN